jgi:hypothetical protein
MFHDEGGITLNLFGSNSVEFSTTRADVGMAAELSGCRRNWKIIPLYVSGHAMEPRLALAQGYFRPLALGEVSFQFLSRRRR